MKLNISHLDSPAASMSDSDMAYPHIERIRRLRQSRGAGGTAFGLAFFRSPAQHAELEQATNMRKFHRKHGGLWAVTFGQIMTLPMSDADEFEDGEFPVAGPKGYPTAARQ